jgi:BR serine/threonine kinase
MSSDSPSFGPYTLIREIGSGTSAKVALAVHSESGEQVAIKIIKKDRFVDNPSLQLKIDREIALMRLFDHPHILKVVEYLQSPRHIYIVLEYASHGELFDFLVENRTLSEDAARNFLRQIIYGLEYLHSLGVCHRDLKPENILLDERLNVKIADFGFARFVKSNVAETSCGSPHYAAPEIIKGQPYNGKAADVWSCGVILFALLAGYLPFDDTSIRGLLMKVKRGQFTMPPFSPVAQDLISRMLTLDPTQRITIEDLKNHEFFRCDLPPDYVLPRPIAMQCMDGPLDIAAISPDLIDVLRKIGYKDDGELAADLQAPGHTMAKVFYFMLTTRFSLEVIDWSQCNGGSLAMGGSIMYEAREAAYVLNATDPFHRDGARSPESLSSVNSLAVRHEWDIPNVPDGGAMEQAREMKIHGMSAVDIMHGLQQLLGQRGLQWIHPDEFTILARNEAVGLVVMVQAWLTGEQYIIGLQIQCFRGAPDAFEAFCIGVREKFAGNFE